MVQSVRTLRIVKPMNAHGHPRDSALMRTIVPLITKRYASCVAMPNLKGSFITTAERFRAYLGRLNAITDDKVRWLVKLYLTETLTPSEIEKVADHPNFGGLKYYPRGLTTGSDDGVSDPSLLWTPSTNPYEVLRYMADVGKPVSYHGADGFTERGEELDPYEQERHFYEKSFPKIVDAHPETVHIGEHVTTTWGVERFREIGSDTIGATITAHHPFLDRRDVYRGGFHPDFFCWPVVQTTEHRDELRKFMTEGHRFVMLGDDGAGHPSEAKYCGCCAGGVFTVGSSVELYAQVFDEMNTLDRFETFASLNGPRFYGIEPSNEYITLENLPQEQPRAFACDDGSTITGYQHPIRPGMKDAPSIPWRIAA